MAHTPHDPSFQIDSVVSSENGTSLTPKLHKFKSPEFLEDERPFNFETYSEMHNPKAIPEINLDPLSAIYPRLFLLLPMLLPLDKNVKDYQN
jgi:hypothetical protein